MVSKNLKCKIEMAFSCCKKWQVLGACLTKVTQLDNYIYVLFQWRPLQYMKIQKMFCSIKMLWIFPTPPSQH